MMEIKLHWFKRYQIALKENLTIKDIMILRDVGQPTATKIRDLAREYCLRNNIDIDSYKVPCDVVLKITERDLNYYYDKMVLEINSIKMVQQLKEVAA